MMTAEEYHTKIHSSNEAMIEHYQKALEALKKQRDEYSVKPANPKTSKFYDEILQSISNVKVEIAYLKKKK